MRTFLPRKAKCFERKRKAQTLQVRARSEMLRCSILPGDHGNHLIVEEARLRSASIRFNSYSLYKGLSILIHHIHTLYSISFPVWVLVEFFFAIKVYLLLQQFIEKEKQQRPEGKGNTVVEKW